MPAASPTAPAVQAPSKIEGEVVIQMVVEGPWSMGMAGCAAVATFAAEKAAVDGMDILYPSAHTRIHCHNAGMLVNRGDSPNCM